MPCGMELFTVKKIITTRSTYHYDCRSARDSVMPPYTLDCFNAPSLHSPTTQGNWEQHCPYLLSEKLIKASGLSQGHTDPAALGFSTTVWGPHCRAPVTWEHLLVMDFTMLISIMPQPQKTPQVKGTKGSCANDFWKANNNLLPPI